MSGTPIRNVSNLAAFGAEWTDSDGTTWQLANWRGTSTLTLSSKKADDAQWNHYGPVEDPRRFGMVDAPRTRAAFMRIAQAFVNSRP
jgi:hypothetical protein